MINSFRYVKMKIQIKTEKVVLFFLFQINIINDELIYGYFIHLFLIIVSLVYILFPSF